MNNLHINWIDGMKINKTHFAHTDLVNLHQRSRNNAFFLQSYHYGLGQINQKFHDEFVLLEENKLSLKEIQAISSLGYAFDVTSVDHLEFDLGQTIQAMHEDPSKHFLVILKANLEKLVEIGEPDPSELPPRFPYVKQHYSLSVIPEKNQGINHNVGHALVVGKLIPEHNRLILDQSYIPPCLAPICSKKLINEYMLVERMLEEIHQNAMLVVQKARSKKKHGEINDLATNTFYLMEKMVFFLAENMAKIKTIYKEQSPIHLFLSLNSFARIILSGLSCIKSEDKEALLRYFESHLGFKPHQFEEEMNSLSHLTYRHFEIGKSLNEAKEYLETIRTYVSKSINLEFHSAERVDVINETVIKKRKLDIF